MSKKSNRQKPIRRIRRLAERSRCRLTVACAVFMATAADKTAAKREEAEAIKAMKLAETEASLAQINAENARSEAQVAMELELARLKAMPQILAEMVKPAEKITGISINQMTGFERNSGDSPTSPINQTVDAIMDMAVSLPALQKLGDRIGVAVDTSLMKSQPKAKDDD